MTDDVVIRLEGVWKRYGLLPALRERWHAHRDGALGNGHAPWALRDINLEVKRGETLGIVGRNGAGKSTLLKVLAGVTPPTRGRMRLEGKIFPMIELNAGLHQELTGRENVRLLGAIIGLRRTELEARIADIEEFTELGESFDRPVRTYSTGMLARLGFAVAVNTTADILLVDEVMSVGDLAFQNRCLERMRELRENGGVTIIFVSHGLDMVQYLCPRTVTLESGKIIDAGVSSEVITRYENSVHRYEHGRVLSGRFQLSGAFELESVRITDGQGNEVNKISRLQGFTVHFEGMALSRIADPILVFAIANSRGEEPVREHFYPGRPLHGRVKAEVVVPPLPLSGGYYRINLAVRDRNGYLTHARYLGVKSFVVEADQRERGVLTVPLEWTLE